MNKKQTQETETKILEVNIERIKNTMDSVNAKKLFEDRMKVDWFRLKGVKEGEDPWYLRVRTFIKRGKTYLTWKAPSKKLGASRTHKEIELEVSDHQKLSDLLIEIGLELYAHQEKDRITWTLKKWEFDLDQYPGMPAYLEIEGINEESVQKALKLLSLEDFECSSEGERILIQEKYKLNWYNMKF